MTLEPASPRPFNPLELWADIAVKSSEMWLSASSVIQMRTQRMAQAGLTPTAADLREMTLMGHEKLEAATESGQAMAKHLHTTQFALVNRLVQDWIGSASAWIGMATSASPAQAMAHGSRFMRLASRSAAGASELSNTPAQIVAQALLPIHAKATANARRLALAARREG